MGMGPCPNMGPLTSNSTFNSSANVTMEVLKEMDTSTQHHVAQHEQSQEINGFRDNSDIGRGCAQVADGLPSVGLMEQNKEVLYTVPAAFHQVLLQAIKEGLAPLQKAYHPQEGVLPTTRTQGPTGSSSEVDRGLSHRSTISSDFFLFITCQ